MVRVALFNYDKKLLPGEAMKKRFAITILLAAAAAIALYIILSRKQEVVDYYQQQVKGRRTVSEVVNSYEPAVKARLKEYFERAKLPYPPDKITLIGLKREKNLEVWVETNETAVLLKKYTIFAASGDAGPKLAEGDRQVPEGVYYIEGLNPNSHYHLSMKLNYPNEFDRVKALADKREKLGGDIFIHGKNLSIGCIAIGDEAVEEVFVLSARAMANKIKVIIMPYDMRLNNAAGSGPADSARGVPSWIKELYANIKNEIIKYK